MPIPTSSKYIASENAAGSTLTSKVFLVLGNYAAGYNGASASASSVYSSDYPAAGAIDGDRTELNIGAATVAENGIGKSSWQSSGTTPTSETLTITFAAETIFNRIKIYQRRARGMTYKVEAYMPEYSDWALLYSTTTGTPSTSGYGDGAYGNTPYGDPPEVASTYGDVDTVDIGYDVSATAIRITGIATQVASDTCNIVEVEVYRLVDITSRVLSWNIERKQDYTLTNDLVGSASINVNNTDRFFSPDYTPTAAEIAAGFINGELNDGLGFIIAAGYLYSGAISEWVTIFDGSIDRLTLSPKSRTGIIEGRDSKGKQLVNAVITSKMQQAKMLSENIAYVLELANISLSECSIDDVPLTTPFFYVSEKSAITVLQELTLASGNGRFFISPDGIATFAWGVELSSETFTVGYGGKAGMYACTLTNIDQDSYPGKCCIGSNLDQFQNMGDSLASPWSATLSNSAVAIANGAATISIVDNSAVATASLTRAFSHSSGAWSFELAAAGASHTLEFKILDASNNGYSIYVNAVNSDNLTRDLVFRRYDTGTPTDISTITGYSVSSLTKITLWKSAASTWKIAIGTGGTGGGLNAGTTLSSSENTHNSFTKITIDTNYTATYLFSLPLYGDMVISKIRYNTLDTSHSPYWPTKGIIEGPAINATSYLDAWDAVRSSFEYIASGLELHYYYRSSADNITWGSYAACTWGVSIGDTNQYFQFKAELTPQSGSYFSTDFPFISEISASWTASRTISTPTPLSINFTDKMLDVNAVYTDAIAGDSSVYNFIQINASIPYAEDSQSKLWALTSDNSGSEVTDDNPLTIEAGTYTYTPSLSNPGITNSMVLVLRTDSLISATATINYLHPTKPIVTLVVTGGPGSIFELSLYGLAIKNDITTTVTDQDTASIGKWGKRIYALDLTFLNLSFAPSLAAFLLARLKTQISYIQALKSTPIFRALLNDSVSFIEPNIAGTVAQTYNIVGINHQYNLSSPSTTFELRK